VLSTPNSAGTLVSGSFTIDIDAAIPGQGGQGSTSSTYWTRSAYGGTVFNLPVPAALVFSETVTVNGTTYTSGALNPTLDSSSLQGSASAGSNVFFGSDTIRSTNGAQSKWQMSLYSDSSSFAAYLSDGLPNLYTVGLNQQSSGLFAADPAGTNEFGFTLTSLTPASSIPPGGSPVPVLPTPLPAAAWLLLSGAALLRACSPKKLT
jgi:hypothetical protein